MSDKITPRVDVAFKKLFGVEENKDLLISLINSIVSEEDQVSSVDILNPYNSKNFKSDKLSILDIKAKGHSGKRYNIEIQISDEADYDKRALYYWGKLYTEQLQQAVDYSELNKAIGIHILNFTSIPHASKYHNTFQLLEKETGLHYFKDIELHTIELNKFEISSKGLEASEELALFLPKIKTSLDRWALFLSRHDLLNTQVLPDILEDPSLKKALDVLEVMNFTTEERELYEDHLKWLRIEFNTLKKAHKKGKQEGRVEGEAIGLEKGKVEGEIIGLEKGALKKAREIALHLLAQDLDLNIISQATSLSLEEIKSLKSP